MPSDKPTIRIRIEPLGEHHNRAAFCCGNTYIDVQFQRNVLKMQQDSLSRAFVAVESGSIDVLGFYVMNSHGIAAWEVPDKWEPLLSKYILGGLPAAYVSLFATDERVQGRGIGRSMMADALRRVKRTSDDAMGILAVVLDAIDDKARGFYLSLGFMPFDPDREFRLFYPVSMIP